MRAGRPEFLRFLRTTIDPHHAKVALPELHRDYPDLCGLYRIPGPSLGEVAPDFRTTGLVGGSLLRMALNGAEHDEDTTED